MFLKNIKNNSITTRLTLFYSIATFLLITVIAFFLYGTTIHILHKANYHFLSREVDILANLIKKKSLNWSMLEQKVIEVPYTETGSDYHYFIRILNENNQIVLQTPQMDEVFHHTDFFNKKPLSSHKKIDWWSADKETNYVLIQAPVINGETNKYWRIQIALDISYQQAIINKYHSILAFCLIMGTFFAIFIGYFIARKGMRSLYDLTNATKKITATSLHQQIDPESWPKELKNLAMAFNQMLKRIEISFSRLMEFSADLAHELRTPVNNLMGETELLLSRNCSKEEYQQVLGSNLEELHRITQIIDNIMFLARTENLSLEIKKNPIKVAEEINLICDYYQAMADEKNITMSVHSDAVLFVNSIMFRRTINNLLANALKYTLEKGWVKFIIKEIDKRVHISIVDNGIGIAEEHLPKLFNRFYRIDSARSKQSGGTGLGLAIVKSIMDVHHGTISISSQPGQGTEVLLDFPK